MWHDYQIKNAYAGDFLWFDVCQSLEVISLLVSKR